MSDATPYEMCVCARCGPPFRTDGEDWRNPPGQRWPVSWMALCPECGSKRCAGAVDHDLHGLPSPECPVDREIFADLIEEFAQRPRVTQLLPDDMPLIDPAAFVTVVDIPED